MPPDAPYTPAGLWVPNSLPAPQCIPQLQQSPNAPIPLLAPEGIHFLPAPMHPLTPYTPAGAGI